MTAQSDDDDSDAMTSSAELKPTSTQNAPPPRLPVILEPPLLVSPSAKSSPLHRKPSRPRRPSQFGGIETADEETVNSEETEDTASGSGAYSGGRGTEESQLADEAIGQEEEDEWTWRYE